MKLSIGVKPTRAKAYALILEIKRGEKKLEEEDIDALIRFFAPAIPKQAKTVEQWVSKAVAGKNEPRVSLKYMLVEDGVAYATDGHRAHKGATYLTNGYYDPITFLKVNIDTRRIDIKRVFRGHEGWKESSMGHLEHGATLVGAKNDKPLEYVRVPDAVAVTKKYFLEAINGADAGRVFYDRADSMVGESEFGDWIIMAVRLWSQ